MLWHCWLGGRKGIWPVKIGVWWRWALISPDGVCLSLLIFSCTIKSRGSLLALAHPGGPRKRAVKRLWVACVCELLTETLTYSPRTHTGNTMTALASPCKHLSSGRFSESTKLISSYTTAISRIYFIWRSALYIRSSAATVQHWVSKQLWQGARPQRLLLPPIRHAPTGSLLNQPTALK